MLTWDNGSPCECAIYDFLVEGQELSNIFKVSCEGCCHSRWNRSIRKVCACSQGSYDRILKEERARVLCHNTDKRWFVTRGMNLNILWVIVKYTGIQLEHVIDITEHNNERLYLKFCWFSWKEQSIPQFNNDQICLSLLIVLHSRWFKPGWWRNSSVHCPKIHTTTLNKLCSWIQAAEFWHWTWVYRPWNSRLWNILPGWVHRRASLIWLSLCCCRSAEQ